ncbi:MAG: 1-acyl-sn-glycerol-3-phosphate acyltransferase [Oscillospiraceae bacterium]|nr:1-acyl-sn-glycerol-3-phosphate acyltransferase [Oscillospiraceae bacterium]
MMQTKSKQRKQFTWQRVAMDIARVVCTPLLLVYRMKRLTPEGKKYTHHIQGGAILAANHSSFADPFLLGVAVWYRRLYFLAAEIVMQGKLRCLLLKGVGAIKIDRNAADIEAMHKSVDILKHGYLLSIFPQGGISESEQIETLKSGVVLIALQAGVPIIPMHVVPAEHWYSRRTVVIGDPLDPKAYIQKKFPTTTDIEQVTHKLMEEMNRCAALK